MKEKIAVIGGGAWGTALANLAAENGRTVEIYAREPEVIESINSSNENTPFLSGAPLNKTLIAKSMDDFDKCDTKHVIWTVPTQFSRATARQYKDALKGRNIISASKGIEITTGKLVIYTLKEEIDADIAILSGPTFAIELATKKPTAMSIAAEDERNAVWWQQELKADYLRAYIGTDLIGLEVGGALKNVIAIATGISDGFNFGHNTRAAIITRGLAETSRFGVACGAIKETFLGLSGIGDLVLSATADNSRNRKVGLQLAQGLSYNEIASKVNTVAEGVFTSKAVYLEAQKRGVSMPITEEVYKIIFEHKDPMVSAKELMAKPVSGYEKD